MFNFMLHLNNYEDRKVDNTELDGSTIIDTCRVYDGKQPYETAIQSPKYNDGKWVIVEAYDSVEDAKTGHNKWVGIMSADNLPESLVDCRNALLAQFGKDLFGDEWEEDYPAQF